MPKKFPTDLNARIELEIARHPDGIGIDHLHTIFAAGVRRRTLQRRLAELEQYTPNLTAYLPETLRTQLNDLGRSPINDAPAGTFARDILDRLLIDLAWASSRLECNTYSRLDTERLIAHGQAAAGKDARETQMILNHKAAIEYLVRDTENVAVNAETIIALHAFSPGYRSPALQDRAFDAGCCDRPFRREGRYSDDQRQDARYDCKDRSDTFHRPCA